MHKLRSIHEAKHAINKAFDEARGARAQKKRKVIAAAPVYLKRRAEAEEELPMIEAGVAGREEEQRRAAALRYVIADNKLPKEVFVELMDLMMLRWDEERKRR